MFEVEFRPGRVVAHDVGDGYPELFHEFGLGFLHAHLGLAAGDFHVVGVVGEPGLLRSQRGYLILGRGQSGLHLVAAGDGGVPVGGGAFGGVGGASQEVPSGVGHDPSQGRLGTAARHGLLVAGLGLAFLFRLPKQVGALAADGFGTFLRGAKRQLSLQLHGFDLGERLGGGVTSLGGGFF